MLIIHHGRLLAADTPENLEKHMQGGVLELLVKGERAAVEKAISALPHVTGLDIGQPDAEGALPLTVRAEEGWDVREALFYACADAKTPILMMKSTDFSLERIFLELTQQAEDTESAGNAPEESAAENTGDKETEKTESEGDGQ